GADRGEIFAGRLVVLGQVDDVLELVEVELALGERGVRQFVTGEVDELNRDPLGSGGIDVVGPVRVGCSDDTDLHGVCGGTLALRDRVARSVCGRRVGVARGDEDT